MFESTEEFDTYGMIESKNALDLFVSITSFQEEEQVYENNSTKSIFSDINPNDVYGSIMKQCKEIGECLGVHPLIAYMLLEHQNWNKHQLFENYSQISTTMMGQLGLTCDEALDDPSIHFLEGDELMTCDVCYEDYPKKEFLSLPCGHAFCLHCWQDHVNHIISTGKSQISCPEDGCLRKLPPASVQLICGQEIYSNLLKYIMDMQVSLADTLTICPNPKCSIPINLLNMKTCNVIQCSCGHEFCSLCNEESHAPSTCSIKEKWLLTTDDELMQKRLFGPGVKQCPNCKAIIEKNEGCNKMVCIKCNHAFCWMCLAPWSTHNDHFRCPNYKLEDDPYMKPFDNISKPLIDKYHDPFVRYQSLAKGAKDKFKSLHHSIVSNISNTSLDSNYVSQQVSILLNEYRYALMNIQWSYPLIFFRDYEKVKDLPVLQQVDIPPPTSQELLFQVALNDLKNEVETIGDKIESVSKKKDFSINHIKKMIKHLQIFRNCLLKQVDPHYHVDFHH